MTSFNENKTTSFAWDGKSGKAYFHSIYPLADVPSIIGQANFVLARPGTGGKWDPVYIGSAQQLRDALYTNPKVRIAEAMGATHCHVYLFANTATERQEVLEDIQAAWDVPVRDVANTPASERVAEAAY